MCCSTSMRSRRQPESDEQPAPTHRRTDPRRRQRRHKNTTPSLHRTATPVPSLAVLTILATFCAESVVAVPPVAYRCPNFLCPFLAPSQTPVLSATPPLPPSPASVFQAISKRKPELSRRSLPNGKEPQKLPTKYLKGKDGRYRPESTWSLHGQTLTCDWVIPSPSAIDEMDNVDTPVSPADVGLPQNSALADSSTNHTQLPDDLPVGWATQPPRSAFYQVPVIIVFALTLTLFITVLIASCALLRRKRRLRRLSLLQKEVSSELERGPDDTDGAPQAIRSRKRRGVWSRSSGRLRSSALACRRRRVRSSNHPSVASINMPERSPEDQHSLDISTTTVDVLEPSDTQEVTQSRQASLPPAYPSRSGGPASTELVTQQEIEQAETQHPKPPSSQEFAALTVPEPSSQPSTSMYGAHLAVDDKAVLERLANNASSPQMLGVDAAASPHAPEWADSLEAEEEYESSTPIALQFPLPGSEIEPTVLSVYDDSEGHESIGLLPSSPISEGLHTAEMPSAPPMDG